MSDYKTSNGKASLKEFRVHFGNLFQFDGLGFIGNGSIKIYSDYIEYNGKRKRKHLYIRPVFLVLIWLLIIGIIGIWGMPPRREIMLLSELGIENSPYYPIIWPCAGLLLIWGVAVNSSLENLRILKQDISNIGGASKEITFNVQQKGKGKKIKSIICAKSIEDVDAIEQFLTSTEADIIACPNCGSDISVKATFCNKCGACV